MISRLLFHGLFLVAVAALPYFSSQWLKTSRSQTSADVSASLGSTAADGAVVAPNIATPHPISGPGTVHANGAQADAPPIVGLAEALRFDVTTAWLFQRWPRVTAGLPEGELQGYRVPLVSGTREDDVAGSLTYYFNSQQVCQKITLVGTAGDARKITADVVGRFGLLRQTSNDAGLHLYQTRWNGKPVSELKIKAAPVVKSSQPFARYDVQLVLYTWPRR